MSVDPALDRVIGANRNLSQLQRMADMERRISSRERYEQNILVSKHLAAWTSATLQNGWVNEGGTNTTAGYYIDAANFVHLKGSIKIYLSPPTGFTQPPPLAPTVCMTLPTGYRPSERYTFPTPLNYDLGVKGSGAVVVGLNGTITVSDNSPYPIPSGGAPPPNPPDTVHVNLDGMLFRI